MTAQNETIRIRSRSLNNSLPGIEMTSTTPLSLTSTTNLNNDSSNNNSNNIIELHEDKIFSSSSSYTTKILLLSYLFIFTIIIINITLVLLVKGSYVYTVIWLKISPFQKILLQAALALFDICWNTFIITRILLLFPLLMRSKIRVKLHLILLIFNSILAPILATSLTDRNCLADLFQLGDEIQSSGTYKLCDSIDTTEFNCITQTTVTLSTSFFPPFAYSYQYSSAVLVNFIPVFILTYSFLGYIQPILLYSMTYFITKLKREDNSILIILPSILWPNYSHKHEDKKVLLANPIISGLLHHIIVLLTFGILCPPLGVVIATSIYFITLQWEFIIGRYLNLRKKKLLNNTKINPNHLFFGLENACAGVWMGPYKAVYWMIDVTCVVYSFLFFDMAGDKIGGYPAFFYLAIPTLTIPLFIRLFYRIREKIMKKMRVNGRQKSTSRAEDIQVHIIDDIEPRISENLSTSSQVALSDRRTNSSVSSSAILTRLTSYMSSSSNPHQDNQILNEKNSSFELSDSKHVNILIDNPHQNINNNNHNSGNHNKLSDNSNNNSDNSNNNSISNYDENNGNQQL